MVEIKSELFAEPKENGNYEIVSAKETTVKSNNSKYEAIAVTMKSTDKLDTNVYTVTLWLQDTSSSTSKLGSFLVALGTNTDDWIGKTIKIRSWRNKQREIEVIQ